ncbi:carbamoyl phosphate synthase [Salimicrobium jeotgali]|uniref:Carbamoyl phosphate synthase n=1 Tax=Salimicrobium jeotgali TaxID=1230341 RepID=K2FJM2_9BACI|nr:ATP-grasp domain-containing protein [Salimicrobium jeotgali]AKG03774.1 carbamoyl phosphate synthase [Salimicrobium jeotgali]EKE31256.1 carbamoyl phosphate synthase-like protein [Salimicrobium jeotgali]MBM7697068.1 carbamoyl-phosphate synthase large subunit [Salimicrobium jeotgali]
MNVLILSCGTRNKIVQYFKQELEGKGKVIATDCSSLAPALYEADEYYLVSRIDEPGYIHEIFDICKENRIDVVFSLIDPELSLLAEHKKKFLELGVMPVVSEKEVVELCLNKYNFQDFLKNIGLNYIKSYTKKEEFFQDVIKGEIKYPVFVKPINGSSSLSVSKAYSKKEVELLFERKENLIIQEFIEGKEYGVDAYIDLYTREPVSIFIKEKISMRAGETDKAVSLKNKSLLEDVENFLKRIELVGIIDIDVFEKNGDYYISEVNPRFGGGYPLAQEAGANMIRNCLNNIEGKVNNKCENNYEEQKYMMKFNEVFIK